MTILVSSFCLTVLIIVSAGYSDAAVSCDSSLRNLFPHLFGHCNNKIPCAHSPWGRWFYTGVLKSDSRCASGKVRQHNRTRTVSNPTSNSECQLQPEHQAKYECEPTLNQKAILFIKKLRLGSDADNPTTDTPVTRPTTPRTVYTPRPTTPRRVYTPRPTTPRRVYTPRPTTPRRVYTPRPTTPSLVYKTRPTTPRWVYTPRPTTPRWLYTHRPTTSPPCVVYPTTQSPYRFGKRKRSGLNSVISVHIPVAPITTVPPYVYSCKRRRSSEEGLLSRSYRQAPTYGYCPTTAQQPNNRVCRNIGCNRKRSANEEFTQEAQRRVDNHYELADLKPTPLERLDPSIPVEEFDLEKYIDSIHDDRTKRETGCTNATHNQRYVLFILDTSGSIGLANFTAAKNVIANISEALCDHLKVALLTYERDNNLEFCFNCHNDRRDIKQAILRARYRNGPATHTTDAIKCACEQILSTQCGLPQGIKTPDIDVVLLTDGQHNGPCEHNLNLTVKCLHDRANINTFAIGIGHADYRSVRDLTNAVGTNIFRVDTFTQLKQLFELIQRELATKDAEGNPVYSCVGHDARGCQK